MEAAIRGHFDGSVVVTQDAVINRGGVVEYGRTSILGLRWTRDENGCGLEELVLFKSSFNNQGMGAHKREA